MKDQKSFQLDFHAISHIASRANNEDFIRFFVPAEKDARQSAGAAFVLADGVGGAEHGEKASQLASQVFLELYYQPSRLPIKKRMEAAFQRASQAVWAAAEKEGANTRMATTMVAAVISGDHLYVANVGDSRAYLLRAGQVTQLTRDHNQAAELVRGGVLTEEQALKSPVRNRLTRSIGGKKETRVDIFDCPLQLGDRILLCSDGLTRYLLNQDLPAMWEKNNVKSAAEVMIRFALKKGGDDNVSVVPIEVVERAKSTLQAPVFHNTPRAGKGRASADGKSKGGLRWQPALAFLAVGIGLGILVGVLLTGQGGVLAQWFPALNQPVKTAQPASPALKAATPTIEPTTAPVQEPALGIGSSKVSAIDGMTLLYVPAGEFRMGSESGAGDEKPVHSVYLDAYWMDKTEVTNAQYRLCVQAGACQAPKDKKFINTDFDAHPVVNVNWRDANDYCTWAGRRLPTEAEWEKAARGIDERTYPWGKGIDCGKANYLGCKDFTATSPVDYYLVGASPYGVLDMAGNVWEWVADWYGESSYRNSPASNPTGPASGPGRILRGGAWDARDVNLRSTARLSRLPDFSSGNCGFRCAMDANERQQPAKSVVSAAQDGKCYALVINIPAKSCGKMRLGWGTDSPAKYCILQNGDRLELTARNPDGQWVKAIASNGKVGWVSMELIDRSISGCNLPILN